MFEVFELLGVVVGEEVEVRALALGDGHGAGDEADVGAVGGEEAGLEAVDGLVEVFDLVVFGGLGVPLFGDGGVGLGGDFRGFEGFGHFEGWIGGFFWCDLGGWFLGDGLWRFGVEVDGWS